MTETANPKLANLEDLFKDLVWDNLIDAALAYLFAQVPVTAVWPLKQIITYCAHAFGNYIFTALRLFVDLGSLALMNREAQRKFDDASVKLKIIARVGGTDTEEFRKAKDEAKQAMANFVRYRGD